MAIFNTVYGGEWKWKPWSNTLMYLPIDSDDTNSTVYDHSWNSKNNTWYGTASYDTLTSWKKVINLTWSNWIYIDEAIITSQPCTVNVWVYRDWSQNNDATIFVEQNWHDEIWIVACYYSTNIAGFYWDTSSWRNFSNQFNSSDKTRYNLVLTLWNNTITMYINWEQKSQATWNTPVFTWVPASSLWFARSVVVDVNYRFMKWKIWAVILENKVRTLDEITKYYNSTKANYS